MQNNTCIYCVLQCVHSHDKSQQEAQIRQYWSEAASLFIWELQLGSLGDQWSPGAKPR